MSLIDPSTRLALLSYALSVWVEGSAQLRNVILMITADIPPNPPVSMERPRSDDWATNLLFWLTKSARELDHTEKAVIAGHDLASAIVVLQLLKIKPLIPFLLTPILATVPLPRTFTARSLKTISWLHVIAILCTTTLLGESNKATLLHLLRLWRRHQAMQRKLTLGKVVARGVPLIPPTSNEEEEEEIECLICSGVGTDEVDPMAQSISSFSSANIEAGYTADRHNQSPTFSESFGPLESFCTTAPRKHALHRDCGLRWIETYRQQHMRVFIEPVNVEFQSPPSPVTVRDEKTRIKSFMSLAGFENMSQSLIFPSYTRSSLSDSNESASTATLSRRGRAPSRSTTLTIPSNTGSLSTKAATLLGTLHTSSPSCPACRGPLHVQFVREPLPAHARPTISPFSPNLTSKQRYQRSLKLVKWFFRGWLREHLANVTGRSLGLRLTAQFSFLLVLVSMIKATGRPKGAK